MRNYIAAGTAVVLAIASGVTAQGGCRVNKGFMEAGNYYCDAVNHILYTSVSQSGTYDKVVNMIGCQMEPHAFGGPMAPFNEELSMHFNGPLNLKRFAVYTPGSGKKRSVKPSVHQRRHNHQHFHEHNKEIREIQERDALGEVVTVTMDGKVVQWTNNYNGGSPASPNAAPTAPAAANPGNAATSVANAAPPTPSFNAGTGSWGRQAYYSAADATREGLVFLTSAQYNSSLDFATADGSGVTSFPQTLKDGLLADEHQIVIMSDQPCLNGECGAVRENSVAYHGFGGAEKLFLMEFSMPITGRRSTPGPNQYFLDQPKIWALNAQIPRTGQFDACSCWQSTCGEFDLFETLNEGGTRCKSTFHMAKIGGNSDYFERPAANTITAAVLFTGDAGAAHIKVLGASHSFDKSLAGSDVEALCKEDQATSVFDVSQLPNANGKLPL